MADPIVNQVRSNETLYKIQDTDTANELSTLKTNYQNTVNTLNSYMTSTDSAISALESTISSVESSLSQDISDLNTSLRNYYDPQISDLGAADINQQQKITAVEGRCSSLESSVTNIEEVLLTTSKIILTNQTQYEEWEATPGTIKNDVLYIIWHPNKLERLYYQGHRLDVIPYEAVDFLINYLDNNNYWDNTILDFEFVPSSVIETNIKIDGNSHTPAYIDNSDELDIKVYAESEHFSISDFHEYFLNYTQLQSVNFGSVRNVSNFSHTFENCISLVSFSCPQSTSDSDWSYAFYGCINLTEVHVTGTDLSHCFEYCPKLTTVYIDSTSDITDVTWLIAIKEDETPGIRIMDFYVSESRYDQFVSMLKAPGACIFGEPYGELDEYNWSDLPDGQGCKYVDNPDVKSVTIHKVTE